MNVEYTNKEVVKQGLAKQQNIFYYFKGKQKKKFVYEHYASQEKCG